MLERHTNVHGDWVTHLVADQAGVVAFRYHSGPVTWPHVPTVSLHWRRPPTGRTGEVEWSPQCDWWEEPCWSNVASGMGLRLLDHLGAARRTLTGSGVGDERWLRFVWDQLQDLYVEQLDPDGGQRRH
jgi:hypothetical protein